nr:MAG TPA: hypothetical protein [Caudoviricetes sp.]
MIDHMILLKYIIREVLQKRILKLFHKRLN